jgi:hypothetical protein
MVILGTPMIDDLLPPDDFLFTLLCNFNSSEMISRMDLACGRQYIIWPLNFPPCRPAQEPE